MARKRRKRTRRNSLAGDVGGLVGAGVGLGVGSLVVSKAGGSPYVGRGLSTMGGMMSPVAMGVMAGHAVRGMRRLQPKKRKRSRRK